MNLSKSLNFQGNHKNNNDKEAIGRPFGVRTVLPEDKCVVQGRKWERDQMLKFYTFPVSF